MKIRRETKETKIELDLKVDGSGRSEIETGIGFFDHMLTSLTKHARWDLKLYSQGDLEVDFHHSVEDVGIVLGEAFFKEVFPLTDRERFGEVKIVMDEAMVECVVDLSNRPFLVYEVDLDGKIGEFDAELVEEFFRAFVFNARITCHLTQIRGKNRHHIAEASFKALALALRRALREDSGGVPSTKGVV